MEILNFKLNLANPATPYVSDIMQGGKTIAIAFPEGEYVAIFVQESSDGTSWHSKQSISPTLRATFNVDADKDAYLRVLVSKRPVEAFYKDYSGGGGIAQEFDPTVPSWAKQPQKPTYTAEEVGASPASVEGQVAELSLKVGQIEGNQTTVDEIKEVMQQLPDGSAVSAQVAVNTEKLSELIADDETFAVIDKDGHIAFKIDKYGNVDYNGKGKGSGKSLEGYTLFSLGDSLSVGGVWQNKVAELTGCDFSANDNRTKILSVGGTQSMNSSSSNSMFWRAKNLVDSGLITDAEKTIVMLECVNDFMDAANDYSFIPSARAIKPTAPIVSGNFPLSASTLQGIASGSRSLNACVRTIRGGQTAKRIRVATLPNSNGLVELRVYTDANNYISTSFEVVTSDTQDTILAKVLNCSFAPIVVTEYEGGHALDFINCYGVTLKAGTTGMVFSGGLPVPNGGTNVTDAKSYYDYWFVGDSLTDWEDTTKWKSYSVEPSVGYKSVIEYLLSVYPKLHIVVGMFPIHSCKKANFYDAESGRYKTYEYSQTDRMLRSANFEKMIKAIADYYCIPMVNVFRDCGIGITNYSEYYDDNNVHPHDNGYERWGNVIAAGLLNFIR